MKTPVFFVWVGRFTKAAMLVLVLGATFLPLRAQAQFGDPMGYKPMVATMSGQTIELTGHDLTIDQVIDVARHGAKVKFSASATQRMADNYGLLLEAPAEGISVYWFTRGAGGDREARVFEGDAMTPKNKAFLEKHLMERFTRGADGGENPEIVDEALVRAVMVVRANAMTFNAPSPQLYAMLIEMLNRDVTPVMRSRGSVGEGDLTILSSIGGTMVGAGEAYFKGVRMSSANALAKAGLKPIQPFAADDNALISSDAYMTAMAVFAVFDAKIALAWADLTYAIDLNGMNSSLTPLTYVVQSDRPFKWLNWDANRIKEMLKGSYLFGDDKGRIIQDPETLRASSIRQGSAWEAWASLRDDLVVQLNSSDHNPAIRVGVSPEDSWELNTPEMLKYYVKGGKYSNGKHGFIFSNANWDPYPIANKLEAFTIAMANMDIVIWQRDERFDSEFFTGSGSQAVLKQLGEGRRGAGYFSQHEVWQHIQAQINPVPPEGYVDGGGVEELEAQTTLKAQRAMAVVADTFRLVATDLNTGMRWLDVRKIQDSTREFGPGPTAAWIAYRKVNSLQAPSTFVRGGDEAFLRENPAWNFIPMVEPK
jgi:histidine ammonia-lyase